MINRTVARRYAKGLLHAALDRGTAADLEALVVEINSLANAVRDHDGLRLLIVNPAIETAQKKAVLGDLADHAGAGALTKRFVEVLADKERLDQIEGIATVFSELVDQHRGVISAEVTTPTPLDSDVLAQLRDRLATATGSTVRMATRTDPELLGGLVTRIGDVLYDGSLRHQLAKVRARMTGTS